MTLKNENINKKKNRFILESIKPTDVNKKRQHFFM